jgi:hypothetical protein
MRQQINADGDSQEIKTLVEHFRIRGLSFFFKKTQFEAKVFFKEKTLASNRIEFFEKTRFLVSLKTVFYLTKKFNL